MGSSPQGQLYKSAEPYELADWSYGPLPWVLHGQEEFLSGSSGKGLTGEELSGFPWVPSAVSSCLYSSYLPCKKHTDSKNKHTQNHCCWAQGTWP